MKKFHYNTHSFYKSHCDDRFIERVNLFIRSKEECCSTPFGVVCLWLILGFLLIHYPDGIKIKACFLYSSLRILHKQNAPFGMTRAFCGQLPSPTFVTNMEFIVRRVRRDALRRRPMERQCKLKRSGDENLHSHKAFVIPQRSKGYKKGIAPSPQNTSAKSPPASAKRDIKQHSKSV